MILVQSLIRSIAVYGLLTGSVGMVSAQQPAPRDQSVEPAPPSRISEADKTAATDEAVVAISKALSLKTTFATAQIAWSKKLKDCAGLPDTNTKTVNQGQASGNAYLLVAVKGESSGTHVTLGTDCKNSVVLNVDQAVAISLLADHLKTHLHVNTVTGSIVPVKVEFKSRGNDDNSVVYMTANGTLGMIQDGTKYDVTLKNKKGDVAYHEIIDFKK